MTIQVHPSLIVWLSILFYLSPQLLLPFFLAASIHEAGHYLMLCRLKMPPSRLTISFTGAAMEIGSLSYREEVLAAAAGPTLSLILALLWPLCPKTALYSLILGLVNLFPVPGLDGYRILQGLMQEKLEPGQASMVIWVVSVCFGIILTLVSIFLSLHGRLGCWPLVLSYYFLIRSLIQRM